MPGADYLAEGTWNAECQLCGRKYKAQDLIRHWQGGYHCFKCWKPRHPQDFVRAIPDRPAAPWVQHYPERFSEICDLFGISCLADYAVADCSICDYGPTFEMTDADIALALDEDEDVEILTDSGLEIFP